MTWREWLLIAAAAVLAAGAYRYSLWRHPTRNCHTCGGKGRHTGAVWAYAQGPCKARTLIPPRATCEGGRVPRWGLRLLKPPD